MKLSVIIPTRNRAKLLSKALDSLLKQTLNKEMFEVIVIDNGSLDHTKKIVDSFINKILNIRYFYEEEPGLHIGRHKGLREAKSDILVYLDDDVELFPQHLENVLVSFKDEKVGLVGGKCLPKFEDLKPQWILDIWNRDPENRYIWSLSILDFGDNVTEIDPNYIFGCNFCVRKEIIINAGGFHPDAMPKEKLKYRGDGETYISQYIRDNNFTALYNPDVSVHHFVSNKRTTEEYFEKRNFDMGISDAFRDIRLGAKTPDRTIKHFSDTSNNFTKAYLNGYIYLFDEIKKDDELISWITQDTYL